MKPLYKLIGSAPSLDHLKELIERYWHSRKDTVEIIVKEGFTYDVYQSGKVMHGFRVVHKGDRFRFEGEVRP